MGPPLTIALPGPDLLGECVFLFFIFSYKNVFFFVYLCNIVIYNKYLFGFCPLFWHWSLVPENPWNFLCVESVKGVFCYDNEVTSGKPSGHLSFGARLAGEPTQE